MFLLLFSLNSIAASDLPGESVYATGKKQEEIALLFGEDNLQYLYKKKIYILKESITPVYFVDLFQYLRTGNWELQPTCYKDQEYYANSSGNETFIYKAKTITYDGLYAGDITLFVSDKKVEIVEFEKSETNNNISMVSYADHKVRVENGRKWTFANQEYNEIMPYTRYVLLGEFGSAFYVKRNIETSTDSYNIEYLVALDSTKCIFEIEKKAQMDILHFDTDMEKVVDFLESLKYDSTTGLETKFEKFTPQLSNTISIVNINEYLNTGKHHFFIKKDNLIGYVEKMDEVVTESETLKNNNGNENQSNNFYIVDGIIVVFAGVSVFIILFKRCKLKNN